MIIELALFAQVNLTPATYFAKGSSGGRSSARPSSPKPVAPKTEAPKVEASKPQEQKKTVDNKPA